MAVEKTMKEAVDMEDFERWQKGLPPKKKKTLPPPEPAPLDIKNLIRADKIRPESVLEILQATRKPMRNRDGVVFTGFNVSFRLAGKKEGEPETVSGWMPDADWVRLRRNLFRIGRANMNKVSM